MFQFEYILQSMVFDINLALEHKTDEPILISQGAQYVGVSIVRQDMTQTFEFFFARHLQSFLDLFPLLFCTAAQYHLLIICLPHLFDSDPSFIRFDHFSCLGEHFLPCAWVRFSLEEIKYLIFSFPLSGNEAKRGVDFRYFTRNASRIWRKGEDEVLKQYSNTRFPRSLSLPCCLPIYMGLQRDADFIHL